ncbi:MAG: glycosyltransferase family 2 protein [Ferruginibacter sp.]
MRLSIIIVNYKTAQLVLNCLASVYKYNTIDVEIFVVDNLSNDRLEILLQNKYPNVFFIQMGYNAGFARANNAAIKLAIGENILLLNSDTINIEDAVNKCDKLLRESFFSAAGVQLLNEDNTPQISGNYAMKGGLNYLLPLPFTGVFLKTIANLFKVKKPSIEKAETTIEVDWINGAFLMVKKSIIEKVGLLDEDFFLYAEEAEWCSRIKKKGRLCIFGELNIFHLQGESSNSAFGSEGKGYFNLFDKKGLQIILSNFVRIRKQFGLFWFAFDLVFYFLTIPVFFVGTLISKLGFSKKYHLHQVKGFTKNMFSLIKYLPVIVKNKPFFYKVL